MIGTEGVDLRFTVIRQQHQNIRTRLDHLAEDYTRDRFRHIERAEVILPDRNLDILVECTRRGYKRRPPRVVPKVQVGTTDRDFPY
jgi:hypothetical protein